MNRTIKPWDQTPRQSVQGLSRLPITPLPSECPQKAPLAGGPCVSVPCPNWQLLIKTALRFLSSFDAQQTFPSILPMSWRGSKRSSGGLAKSISPDFRACRILAGPSRGAGSGRCSRLGCVRGSLGVPVRLARNRPRVRPRSRLCRARGRTPRHRRLCLMR